MRTVSQGAARRAVTRTVGRTRAHRGPRRGGRAARTSRLIGAIVAGGGATRFGGGPKGLGLVDGERIVDRVRDALTPVTDDVILISNDPNILSPNELPVVYGDIRPERGSLVGLHTALVTASGDDVLAVAWDMPFVTTSLLWLIRHRFTQRDFAAVPETDMGLQPLCAAYSARCVPYLEEALDAGRMRFSAFVDRLPVARRIGMSELRIAGDPERMFFNVNTPDDLETANRMARGG